MTVGQVNLWMACGTAEISCRYQIDCMYLELLIGVIFLNLGIGVISLELPPSIRGMGVKLVRRIFSP